MSRLARMSSLGGIITPTYADDVFSAYMYGGTGVTQTITNGIDLAGKGGLVWQKNREQTGASGNHVLVDSSRPASNGLYTNLTQASENIGTFVTFNSSGFTAGNGASSFNQVNNRTMSLTFRKAAKFFDIVTYNGDGNITRNIAHSLGSAPGLVIIKNVNSISNWIVAHVEAGGSNYKMIRLNSSSAEFSTYSAASFNSSTFGVAQWNSIIFQGAADDCNTTSNYYIAYLFANDTSASGLIRCGSFTTDASGNASVASLNWEPQFLLVKASSAAGDWIMLDTIRSWSLNSADLSVFANTNGMEATSTDYGNPTVTGFNFKGGSASTTYVYMAIRRPNKVPTVGTSVFNLFAGNTQTFNPITQVISTSSARNVDAAILVNRSGSSSNFTISDRVRGFQTAAYTGGGNNHTSPVVVTSTNAAETNTSGMLFQRDDLNGSELAVWFEATAGFPPIGYALKRAPAFFDIVAYAGTGVATTVPHNLSVAPELLLIRPRTNISDWAVYAAPRGNSSVGALNSDSQFFSQGDFNNTTPTATVFSVSNALSTNGSGRNYIAYLFATLAGISKVGSYTGNGTSQTINAGFTTGARFILIKRTNASGDWYVWDTARGIVAGTDPHISMNATVAEVTTDDSIDPDTSGFIVNQLADTNINVTSAIYIYLAIA